MTWWPKWFQKPAQHSETSLAVGADCAGLPQVSLSRKPHALIATEPNFGEGVPRYVGAASSLDTDLCKLTMQGAIFEYFPAVPVTYELTNRTPAKKFTEAAFHWLQEELSRESIFEAPLPFSHFDDSGG